MRNRYGVQLDRNGYAPSIITHDEKSCFICSNCGDLARHEIFNGNGLRRKSKNLGLWVPLCPHCHEQIHADRTRRNALKRLGQIVVMEHYHWNQNLFLAEFYRNYKED